MSYLETFHVLQQRPCGLALSRLYLMSSLNLLSYGTIQHCTTLYHIVLFRILYCSDCSVQCRITLYVMCIVYHIALFCAYIMCGLLVGFNDSCHTHLLLEIMQVCLGGLQQCLGLNRTVVMTRDTWSQFFEPPMMSLVGAQQ